MAAPWGRIRQGYMAGKTYRELAEKYKLSVKTIQNRASKEGWVAEKGKIKEEVGKKIHARVVRARVEQLEKLIDANEKLIDGLLAVAGAMQAQSENNDIHLFMDEKGSLKNAEAFAKAIQTAVATQRDLYKLPTLEQDYRKKEEAQRKREAKARMDLEREKWEAEKTERAKAEATISGTMWQLEAEEEMDG